MLDLEEIDTWDGTLDDWITQTSKKVKTEQIAQCIRANMGEDVSVANSKEKMLRQLTNYAQGL